MSNREKDQIIALSALFQAAELVTKLAKTGQVDQSLLTPILDSVFIMDAANTCDIYGGEWEWSTQLSQGKKLCKQTLGNDRSAVDPDIIRYALSLLHLEAKLSKDKQMLSTVGQKLTQLIRQREHFDASTHSNMIAAMSGLYQDTLSTLSFRVQVQGDSRYLQQQPIAEQVRAILLAGVRAAILWRQLGGRRWHFLLKRKSLIAAFDKR
ncbi:high frequency lysogenization protein HflD [Marinomonas sp. 15G1-11]|uniref:High frequency lysogenization protein HflD homolog n=1 Tax=Marinomonas phaeophyticola TaxID=3004091 RepID=A0ABT4JYB5_9GAMM|nr:high frequency lysogenization protein HflD [Marinomonas sp. 15G1-11]MCZ2723210.1 high frequency lysogenization protein HflD [Marinomonas sp. 15G1-11]